MKAPQNLETRFTMPDGWRWHSFTRAGRTIRFGSAFPKDTIPDAVVVCLHGVREFSEKYFETARWCLEHNFAFWTFDWAGQGLSTRFLPHKRHSHGFDEDVEDLHYLILEYIKHSSVHPDKGRIPMVMLAHSMGANIGLRYLHKYKNTFTSAAFSAPMIGIKVFEYIPPVLALTATNIASLILGKNYVPGATDWENVKPAEHETLSADPVRADIHNIWCAHDSNLATGGVTFDWLHEAQRSCMALRPVSTPCVFGIPAHEHLVDNKRARKFIEKLPHAKIIDFPNSHHEILMEKDETRTAFLNAFYNLVKETVIDRPETLKPF